MLRIYGRQRGRGVPRRPWRLRTRLAIALVIVVAPIAALLILSHVDNLKEQRRSQVESVQVIGDTLRASVDGFARDLESLSFAASIALADTSTPNQITAGGYLENLRDSYSALRGVFITDLNGRIVASDSTMITGPSLADRPYVQALQRGDDIVWTGGRLIAAETGKTTTVHGRAIREPGGRPVAYLFFALYPADLTSRLPGDLPPDSNVTLLDDDGTVLFTTASPGDAPDNVADSVVFMEASNGGRVLLEGEASPVDEGDRYGVFMPVTRTNWVVGFTRPASAIDGPFESRLQRDIAVMTVLILGGIIFMLLVASKLSKPLSSLAGTADAIARGEQPIVPIDAADADVRRLERAIQQMNQAINEREERLLAQTRVGETLERVGETLATELDFDDAVSSISVAAMQLTQAQAVGIYYSEDDEGKGLRLLGAAGSKTFPLAAEDPLVRRTLAGEVLDVPEIGVFPGALLLPPRIDGAGVVHSFLGIPITSRFGDVHGGLFLLHDKQAAFTERHRLLAAGLARRASIVVENARLYSQARQQQEELRQASMQKSEFIGMMSHELRTPITTIFGGARLLNSRRASLDQESFDEMIVSIEEEAERLYRLVENLLTLAKTDLYENVEMDILSIGPVVDQAVKQFSNRHPGRPIEISVERGVPLVMGEPAYLHQVLNNLITNADKYSEAGKQIDIGVTSNGSHVTVKVMDRGPGVDPQEIDMIFESFYRSKSTARQAGGKGLGLTVCKRLIEAMSGTIWVSNRKAGGLEACFTLPIAVLDETEEEAELPMERVSSEPRSR